MQKRILALKKLRKLFRSLYIDNPDSIGLRYKIDLLTSEIVRLRCVQSCKNRKIVLQLEKNL
jgi:hypothetical protein